MADGVFPVLRTRRRLLVAQIVGLGLLAVVVVVAVIASRSPSGPPVIFVGDAWARATPAGAATAAVYLTIENEGGEADRLVSASTPAAGDVMIHRTAIENNVATMAEMEGVAVDGGATVTLAPNGTHLMLMDLSAPLLEGDAFPMTLTFATAGDMPVTVTVGDVAAAGPAEGDE